MTDTASLAVTPETLLALHAATPTTARKTRQGPGGKSLTYVDARYVMQVLDTELGPSNWQSEFTMSESGKVSCRIGIHVEDRGWVWKGDGAGETDIEGEKGSFSDAFKRAAVHWGIARDLYGEEPTTQGQAPATSAPAPAPPAVQSAPEAQPNPMPPGTTPYQEIAAGGGDKCPVHDWTWSIQKGGNRKSDGKAYSAFYKCGGKTDGQFCKQKPSEAWVAAHPIPA